MDLVRLESQWFQENCCHTLLLRQLDFVVVVAAAAEAAVAGFVVVGFVAVATGSAFAAVPCPEC